MPLRLDITRQFSQRSDRVKGVDLHPTEPWLLANLYNGIVAIWNINDNTMLKSFEVTELPVRSARFIARKQWYVELLRLFLLFGFPGCRAWTNARAARSRSRSTFDTKEQDLKTTATDTKHTHTHTHTHNLFLL